MKAAGGDFMELSGWVLRDGVWPNRKRIVAGAEEPRRYKKHHRSPLRH
uniref:Uncharacterized protein n=1 Tax=Fagus sylvatica TaxID=28930 RepID=A0A2N9HRM7_FAGSY